MCLAQFVSYTIKEKYIEVNDDLKIRIMIIK